MRSILPLTPGCAWVTCYVYLGRMWGEDGHLRSPAGKSAGSAARRSFLSMTTYGTCWRAFLSDQQQS